MALSGSSVGEMNERTVYSKGFNFLFFRCCCPLNYLYSYAFWLCPRQFKPFDLKANMQRLKAKRCRPMSPFCPKKNQRNEKKIDPLVVDVDRRPVEVEETKEAKEEPSEGEAEGRFFLKDKLCALGLADVST